MPKQFMKCAALCLAGSALSAVLAGCGRPETGAGPPAKTEQPVAAVKIENFAFDPASLAITPGTTVEWTNSDDVPHTVVEHNARFKSQALDTDDRFRHTFSEPGTYQYFCSIHPHMVGEIHVTQSERM